MADVAGEDLDRRVILMVTSNAILVIDVRSTDLDLATRFAQELTQQLADR